MGDKKYLEKAITLLLPYKRIIISMSILMLLITGCNICIPLLQQKVIDEGLLSHNVVIVWELVLIVCFISIITNISTMYESYLRIDLNATFLKDKQLEILNHSLRLKMKYIKKDGLVQIIKDAEYALNNISEITGNQMSDTLVQIFKFIGVLIGLLLINWKLTCYLLLLIPVRLGISTLMSKHIEKYQMETLFIQKRIHTWEDDIYHSAVEVKLWNLYESQRQKYGEMLEDRNSAVKKMGFYSILSSMLGDGVQTVFFNFLYLLGGMLIWRGTLSIGGILAFISYANYLMEPIGFVTNLKIIFSQIGPAMDMYDEFLALEEEENNQERKTKARYEESENIQFMIKNLNFSFSDRNILKKVNLFINKGDRIAIIGENGSGKTTLLNLIMRFYSIQEGNILLNGIDISNYELESYRNIFSVIMQSPYLFHGSIRDNISLFGKNKIRKELLESKIINFVNKLPEGMDTDIGSNASEISGGEKQKIALLRALASKSEILILDEPTAAYDKKSEADFLDMIDECNKKIVIMITHKPNLLRFANKVIEIKDGNVKMYCGNGAEFLANQGNYMEG